MSAEPVTSENASSEPIGWADHVRHIEVDGVLFPKDCLVCGGKGETRPSPLSSQRPDWDVYFLGIAKAVAARADCRRAKHGAVVVNDRRIVATGYNGAHSGGPSCLQGECPRGLKSTDKLPHGFGLYEDCIAQHAELNALLYAGVAGAEGGTLYVTGEPCNLCRKVIRAAGIARVVWMYQGETTSKHEWIPSYG